MKASLQLQPMYCSRDYNCSSRFNQQYEKPTQERRGLVQLKKEKDRIVLTADQGVAIVVMDKEEYIHKAE